MDIRYTNRLYSKARILGFTRGKRNQKTNTSLIQVEGVADRKEAEFYFGKVDSQIYSYLEERS
jgi:large subunit ribosomal protein L35Ae